MDDAEIKFKGIEALNKTVGAGKDKLTLSDR